jgi:Putative MetA-pathway of phenol degradation
VTVFNVVKRGNELPEVGSVQPGSQIDTDLLVLRYATTVSLAGRQLNPFFILPVGRVTSTTHPPEGTTSARSSGQGDVQVGAVLGLIGSPALPAQAYADLAPGLSSGLFAKVYIPTGAYSASSAVNFGAHRFAFQLGLPTTYAIGSSYRDPHLTTIELFPTLTLYDRNETPSGPAKTIAKDALLAFEGHLTHNFAPSFWLSADVLFRGGGETITDGIADGNATDGWSGGATAAYRFEGVGSLILTYEHVIERNDNGPIGWFFRTAFVIPF